MLSLNAGVDPPALSLTRLAVVFGPLEVAPASPDVTINPLDVTLTSIDVDINPFDVALTSIDVADPAP